MTTPHTPHTPDEEGRKLLELATWVEYDMAALWCARRGIAGKIGDQLPMNMSARALHEIDLDPEAFEFRVRQCAYEMAMSRLEPAVLTRTPHVPQGKEKVT